MPATQMIDVFDGLEFRVEPEEEPDPVYFTSNEPEFDVHITNNDSEYNYSEDSEFRWTIESSPENVVHTGEVGFGPLDNGEVTTVSVGGRVLAYEGHGVLGISIGGASGKGDSDLREVNAGRETGARPAYSFHVWDESHYNAAIERPRKLQLAMVGTSIVLIAFAAVQVILATGLIQ